jgi:hypothetical protein
MNAFIVHSSKDKETVQTLINDIIRKTRNFNHLMLDNRIHFWKADARRKIKCSQIVIFFVGKASHSSVYIGWELREAIKYNKHIIIIKLENQNEIHNALNIKDNFSKMSKIYGKMKTVDELIEMINKYEKGEYALFNSCYNEEKHNILFEQYKLFLATSEALVERRQKVNNFYITANALMVSISGTLMTFSIDTKYKMAVGIALSFVGIILSLSWTNILTTYGNLNSSKMKIISMIERELPASLFDTEWEVLSDSLNNHRYVSFTDSEKRIPKMFIAIYFLIIFTVIVAIFFIKK